MDRWGLATIEYMAQKWLMWSVLQKFLGEMASDCISELTIISRICSCWEGARFGAILWVQSLAKLASALAQPITLFQSLAKAFAAEAAPYVVRSFELSRAPPNYLNLLSHRSMNNSSLGFFVY